MKTVLIITDVFPPLAGAGMKRILKFTKFLPSHGWRCAVLTASNEGFLPLDTSLTTEVPPQTQVYRTYTMESLFQRNGSVRPGSTPAARAAEPAATQARMSPLKSVYKFLGRFLKVPDSRILWLPWAVARGIRLCRQQQVDVLLATGPSFTNFLIGAWIKVCTGKPLLLDVRDAWLADPTRVLEKPYLRHLDARCERFALDRADRVVTTNSFVTRDFARRYPRKPSAAFDTLYNGFDREDFVFNAQPPPATGHRPFTIVHTGRLYAERTPKFFLQALARAFQENPAMRARTKVIFVGSCETYLDGKCIEDYVQDFALGSAVELPGRVSRRRSLEYQLEAHLLLLIIGIVPPEMALTYGISGKLFDYAVCGRPILTLANEGATRELILAHRLGDIFRHEDVDSVGHYILRAFEQYASGQQPRGPDPESVRLFDFSTIAGKLAQHLDAVAGAAK